MASETPIGVSKIGDYLATRDKHTNFGICRRCTKKVYWSTNKVISHIRSGHCSGASEKEVDQFKKEYLYSSPKNLVHRSKLDHLAKVKTPGKAAAKRKSPRKEATKQEKTISYEIETEQDEIDTFDTEDLTDDDGRGSSIKLDGVKYAVKRRETNEHTQYEVHTNSDDKVEFIIVSGQPEQSRRMTINEQPATSELSKEEKFIQAVYPQFTGKTKLQLIDEILDAQRRNDLLQDKVKTFEDTINRLLN